MRGRDCGKGHREREKDRTQDTKQTTGGTLSNLYLATARILPYLLLQTKKNMGVGINKREVNGM